MPWTHALAERPLARDPTRPSVSSRHRLGGPLRPNRTRLSGDSPRRPEPGRASRCAETSATALRRERRCRRGLLRAAGSRGRRRRAVGGHDRAAAADAAAPRGPGGRQRVPPTLTTRSTRRWRSSRSTTGTTSRPAWPRWFGQHRDRVVVVGFDEELVGAVDRARLPPGDAAEIADDRGAAADTAEADVQPILITRESTDRMFLAVGGRTGSTSTARAGGNVHLARRPAGGHQRALENLRRNLASGAWDERYGRLRELEELDVGLRLIRAELRRRRPRPRRELRAWLRSRGAPHRLDGPARGHRRGRRDRWGRGRGDPLRLVEHGPAVEAFEARIRRAPGARHAIAVSNGTAALHLALLAAGCGPGDEVVLPSLNFVAAANAISHTGATPVFCDIAGPHDLNLDPADLERGGRPADEGDPGPALRRLPVRHRPGPRDRRRPRAGGDRGRRACRGSDLARTGHAAPSGTSAASASSPTRTCPIGEGGMLVTDDDELAERAAPTAFARDDDADLGTPPGTRGELRRRRGRLQLPPRRGARRRRARRSSAGSGRNRARADRRSLPRGAGGGVHRRLVRRPPDDTTSAHHLAVVVLPEAVSRDAVRETLRSAGPDERPLPADPPLLRVRRQRPAATATADGCDQQRILTLPLFPHMTETQVDAVTDALFAGLAASAAGGRAW